MASRKSFKKLKLSSIYLAIANHATKMVCSFMKMTIYPLQPEPFLLCSFSIDLLKHIYNNSLGLRKIPRL